MLVHKLIMLSIDSITWMDMDGVQAALRGRGQAHRGDRGGVDREVCMGGW
uniref:Uncharacterized protein n=1 Tax=viral metagenome TaxID=1070528 RepID=A0A6M3M208_9ZZZZ